MARTKYWNKETKAWEYADGYGSGQNPASKDWLSDITGAVITATGDSTVSATTGQSTVGGYVKIIADMYGMAYENVAVGGGTIASGVVNGNGNALFSICDSISSMRSDADIVLISGGVNDQAMINHGYEELGALTDDFSSRIDKTTLYGGLEYLLRQAVYKWSNKTVIFIIPHRMTKNLDYYTAILNACKKYGVPVVDLMENTPDFYQLSEFPTRYTANADGWHANEDGYKTFYVPQILSAIKEHFRGKGETIALVDNNLPGIIGGGGEPETEPETFYPNIAGFVREVGDPISSSDNYLRTDFIPISGRKEAEYDSFVSKGSNMATWAIFDANKNRLKVSGDVNTDKYYTIKKDESIAEYGHMKNTVSITELMVQYPTATYIVMSTYVFDAFKTVLDKDGNDFGWGAIPQYITLR